MPSIETRDIYNRHDYTHKLDERLTEILIVHGRNWFSWSRIGGSSVWYYSAVDNGFLEEDINTNALFRLTDKAIAYINQLGDSNEVSKDSTELPSGEAQGVASYGDSQTSMASWMD